MVLIFQRTVAGVPGVNGHHAPKPVAQEHRTANENAKVTAETVPVQMNRLAIVTHRNVPVSQDFSFLKEKTSKNTAKVSPFYLGLGKAALPQLPSLLRGKIIEFP